MTPSISEHVARSGPLEITEIEFQDPVMALSGEGWALTAMCPWRVLRGDALELSWSTPDAEDRAWDLIGRQVVAADQHGRDAVLQLSDGSSIELSATRTPTRGSSGCRDSRSWVHSQPLDRPGDGDRALLQGLELP